ncbi:MAG: NAD(P)-dependent oxidoreductase [bacterium]
MHIKKVLITGSSGYLGGFVVDRLAEQYELTLFDKVPPREQHQKFRHIIGDIASFEDVWSACEGQDAVVHLVALVRGREHDPLNKFVDVMIKGTWFIAEACAKLGVKRLINISSICASGVIPKSEDKPYRVGEPCIVGGADYYSLAKYLAEEAASAYAKDHDLSVIHLRPGVIDGDGANHSVTEPNNDCKLWFQYVDPRDIAQAIEAVLETNLKMGTYNIVAGREDSLYDWKSGAADFGYNPTHNWPQIPDRGK